jgi:hypothetical protein
MRQRGFLAGLGRNDNDDWGAEFERLQQWADARKNRQANSTQWPRLRESRAETDESLDCRKSSLPERSLKRYLGKSVGK